MSEMMLADTVLMPVPAAVCRTGRCLRIRPGGRPRPFGTGSEGGQC